jgi:hypothetical protein
MYAGALSAYENNGTARYGHIGGPIPRHSHRFNYTVVFVLPSKEGKREKSKHDWKYKPKPNPSHVSFCPPPETRPDLSPETAVLELPLWTGYQSALAVP